MSNATIVLVNHKWVGMVGAQVVTSSVDQARTIKMMINAGHNAVIVTKNDIVGADSTAQGPEQWPINERFGFVTELITMIAKGLATSAIITGPGGLGKTHTVRAALEAAGLTDASNWQDGEEAPGPFKSYKMIKGYSTAKGLYLQLLENKDGIIVFDDIDNIMKDAVSLNLLKGALDSYDKRIISWNADTRGEVPTSFQFNGRVVFISNLTRNKIDNALLTRAYCVDLQMTTAQKLERMRMLAADDNFMPSMQAHYKEEALELISIVGERCNELSLRTLQAITKIRASGSPNWRALSEYVLIN